MKAPGPKRGSPRKRGKTAMNCAGEEDAGEVASEAAPEDDGGLT